MIRMGEGARAREKNAIVICERQHVVEYGFRDECRSQREKEREEKSCKMLIVERFVKGRMFDPLSLQSLTAL
jgi:hypothetical protein